MPTAPTATDLLLSIIEARDALACERSRTQSELARRDRLLRSAQEKLLRQIQEARIEGAPFAAPSLAPELQELVSAPLARL